MFHKKKKKRKEKLRIPSKYISSNAKNKYYVKTEKTLNLTIRMLVGDPSKSHFCKVKEKIAKFQ